MIYLIFWNKTEEDAIDDELSALILNTYTKTEVEALIYNINLTGSENIDTTSNQFSLTFPTTINDEICFHPRAYGVQFGIYAGTSGFAFLQNQQDGAQSIALFNSLDKSCEFFGDLDIPKFYNKSEINSMLASGSADLSNYYTKPQIEALISNINLSDYYTKAEVDSSLGDYSTITYLQDNYMTSLLIAQALMNNYASVTFTIDNFYSKTEIDSTLSDYITSAQIGASCYTKSEIDTTLSLYSPSAQILNNSYSKLYIDNTFISSTETGTLYYNKTEADNMLLSYSTGSYVDYTFYNKAETDTLLADKLTNIGDIDLPGMLDIGTSGLQIHE